MCEAPTTTNTLLADRPADKATLELGHAFAPKFDADGLIPCITVDHATGEVLMFAFMNATALEHTLRTGNVHYWSRSRGKLWLKGESSGTIQRLQALRTDCDQDVLMCRVTVDRPPAGGEPASCHNGFVSCFYREVDQAAVKQGAAPAKLRTIAKPVFDPDQVYGKPS
ncbi:MAG: phosphoribosyl-AMP cyclohydrolase [Planctomycetota bacterium]